MREREPKSSPGLADTSRCFSAGYSGSKAATSRAVIDVSSAAESVKTVTADDPFVSSCWMRLGFSSGVENMLCGGSSNGQPSHLKVSKVAAMRNMPMGSSRSPGLADTSRCFSAGNLLSCSASAGA